MLIIDTASPFEKKNIRLNSLFFTILVKGRGLPEFTCIYNSESQYSIKAAGY